MNYISQLGVPSTACCEADLSKEVKIYVTRITKRLRVYSFAAAIVVALMASTPTLYTEDWTKAVIAALGLIVGIFNIRGEGQMNRFLIAAIGLKVTVRGFLGFPGVQEVTFARNAISNFEVFITAGLIYAAFVALYDALKDDFTTTKKWLYGVAVILIIVSWNIGGFLSQEIINVLSILLLILGLVGGYFESLKNSEEAIAGKGRRFLIAAVAFQLSSTALGIIVVDGFEIYQDIISHLNIILQKATVFSTSALLVIAFISIFFVLDELTDNP